MTGSSGSLNLDSEPNMWRGTRYLPQEHAVVGALHPEPAVHRGVELAGLVGLLARFHGGINGAHILDAGRVL
jgi:hypothetical protein